MSQPFFRVGRGTTALAALLSLSAPLAFGQRTAVEAPHGVVTSTHYLASEAGVEILKKGGNAVDAAIATGFALEVVYPFAGNLAGGGFMMVHLADGRNAAIDFREEAPTAASHDMYLDKNGDLIKGPGGSTVGWRASGVPGTVAGYALAFQKYGSGKVSWADVIEPARRLAADGVEVSSSTAYSLKRLSRLLGLFPESKRIYLKGGEYWKAGEIMKQPELAATFERLQKDGPREFYEGETARRIAEAMQANGGTITLDDLKAYKAIERTPLVGTYRGYTVVTMPPPSSGGIALLQMLEMLQPYDVHALGVGSAAKTHLFVEAMRRAFRDRNTYLGDPAFIQNPIEGMLDPTYVKGLMASYDPAKVTPSASLPPSHPAGYEKVLPNHPGSPESKETTHFDAVDQDGNAVSTTYTLNGAYGSGVTIPGTGLLMNNEMDDFASKPGSPNMFGLVQGEANSIAPHKRPLSSMTPTFVLKDGKFFLATGSPGGPTIINTTLEIITNVIDHGMPVMQAVEAPRFHHQWLPDTIEYEINGLSPDTAAILKGMGYSLHTRDSYEGSYQGDGESIEIDPKTGLRLGASDPRRADGRAVGY